MPKLILHRNYNFLASGSRFKIIVDDKEMDTLKVKETKEFELPVGEHTLQIKDKWIKSENMIFNLSNTKKINIKLNKIYQANLIFLFIIILFRRTILDLWTFNKSDILYWCVVGAAFLGLLYFNTLGRKSVIKMKETDWMS